MRGRGIAMQITGGDVIEPYINGEDTQRAVAHDASDSVSGTV